MKKILTLASALCLISLVSFAQVPQAFKYQAVLRNASNEIIANQEVTVSVTILKTGSGNIGLSETHNISTNEFGLINITIGSINKQDFSSIDWSDGPYEMIVEFGNDLVGTSDLLSVPYALYASVADSVISIDYNSILNKPDLEPFMTEEEFQQTTAAEITSSGSLQVITDAERTKLNSIETGAEVNNIVIHSGTLTEGNNQFLYTHGFGETWLVTAHTSDRNGPIDGAFGTWIIYAWVNRINNNLVNERIVILNQQQCSISVLNNTSEGMDISISVTSGGVTSTVDWRATRIQ